MIVEVDDSLSLDDSRSVDDKRVCLALVRVPEGLTALFLLLADADCLVVELDKHESTDDLPVVGLLKFQPEVVEETKFSLASTSSRDCSAPFGFSDTLSLELRNAPVALRSDCGQSLCSEQFCAFGFCTFGIRFDR